MKNIKILVASILASYLLFSNITLIPTYATENITLNETTKKGNEKKEVQLFDINTLRIDKKEVGPNDKLKVSLKASVNASEINFIKVSLYNYDVKYNIKGQTLYLNYNPETQLFEGEFEITPYTFPGKWYIAPVTAKDNAGHIYTKNYSDFDISNVVFNVINTKVDTTKPTLDLNSLKIDKKDINVNDTVTFSLKTYDNESGIESVYATFFSPSYRQYRSLKFAYNPKTEFYESTLTIDENMENGVWTLNEITIFDKSNNSTYVSNNIHSIDFNVNNPSR